MKTTTQTMTKDKDFNSFDSYFWLDENENNIFKVGEKYNELPELNDAQSGMMRLLAHTLRYKYGDTLETFYFFKYRTIQMLDDIGIDLRRFIDISNNDELQIWLELHGCIGFSDEPSPKGPYFTCGNRIVKSRGTRK